jgi:hypothetical protein
VPGQHMTLQTVSDEILTAHYTYNYWLYVAIRTDDYGLKWSNERISVSEARPLNCRVYNS